MKKVLIALGFMCGAAIAVNAQETPTDDSQDQARNEVRTQDEKSDYSEKEMIATTELPALVSEQLQSQDFSGWTMGNAYRKEKDGQTFYAVEMKSGSDTKIVKFDEQGNKIKEKDKDKKYKNK